PPAHGGALGDVAGGVAIAPGVPLTPVSPSEPTPPTPAVARLSMLYSRLFQEEFQKEQAVLAGAETPSPLPPAPEGEEATLGVAAPADGGEHPSGPSAPGVVAPPAVTGAPGAAPSLRTAGSTDSVEVVDLGLAFSGADGADAAEVGPPRSTRWPAAAADVDLASARAAHAATRPGLWLGVSTGPPGRKLLTWVSGCPWTTSARQRTAGGRPPPPPPSASHSEAGKNQARREQRGS
ncbi:unnamed protein product, partial [Prorocentrum cordatum]